MRFLSLVLLSSCASAPASKPAPLEVELHFARAETQRVLVTRVVEKVTDSTQTGHHDERRSSTMTETTTRQANAEFELVTTGAPEPVPVLIIDPAGQLTRFEHLGEATLALSILLGSRERAERKITSTLREDWSTSVGGWAGRRYRVGEERPEPDGSVFFAGGELPQRITTTLVGWVPCSGATTEKRCVKLRARSLTRSEDVTPEVFALLNQGSRAGEFKKLAAESLVELVTDPNTLLPVTKVTTKRITVQMMADGKLVDGGTTTTTTTSFAPAP